MFAELHFNQDSHKSSSSSSSSTSLLAKSLSLENDIFASMNSENTTNRFEYTGCHKQSDSFSSMNSESLQLCTEGIGFESFDDVEGLKNETTKERQNPGVKVSTTKHSPMESHCGEFRRSRSISGEFPPPISCIGKSGKPWICFKAYRQDGGFVLQEIRIPSQEFLHICREGGRLKLHIVQPNDDIHEPEEEEEESEEEVDEEEENGCIHDDDDEEREADTPKYKAENDLQCRRLQA